MKRCYTWAVGFFLATFGLSLALPVQAERVRFETSLGDFEIQLDEDKAPKTVANFLAYVDEGFYNQTLFHRVIPGFVIQGGGFGPGMQRKPTHKPVVNESGNGLKNLRGTISMARTMDPDSATSQFLISLKDNPNLDFVPANGGRPARPGYAVFGRVVQGMDVVDKIARVKTQAVKTDKHMRFKDVPVEDVVLESVTRLPASGGAEPGSP